MIRKALRRFMLPPDCREVAEVLQSFLDGELPDSSAQMVARHLEHCQRCGIEADVYLQVKRSLEQLATPPDRAAIGRLRSFADRLTADDVS